MGIEGTMAHISYERRDFDYRRLASGVMAMKSMEISNFLSTSFALNTLEQFAQAGSGIVDWRGVRRGKIR
jgi:hypothetical protein